MGKPTGPTNPILKGLIDEMKRKPAEQSAGLWRAVAEDLERPSRHRKVVNLSKLDRLTEENEMVIVPGKVLGSGNLGHKLTISAFKFSGGAKEKIIASGGKVLPLAEAIGSNVKGKRVRVIG